MGCFIIDADNNITYHDPPPPADHSSSKAVFLTEAGLLDLCKGWGKKRNTEIWNSFAGVTPFDDLPPLKNGFKHGAGEAAKRIWAAIQRLAPQASGDAPLVQSPAIQAPPPAATIEEGVAGTTATIEEAKENEEDMKHKHAAAAKASANKGAAKTAPTSKKRTQRAVGGKKQASAPRSHAGKSGSKWGEGGKLGKFRELLREGVTREHLAKISPGSDRSTLSMLRKEGVKIDEYVNDKGKASVKSKNA